MVTSCFLNPLNRRDCFNLRVCHPACLWTHLGFCFYSSLFHLLGSLASAKTSNFLSDSFWGVVTNSQSFGGLPQSLIWLTVHLQAPTAHTGAGSRLGLSTSHLWPEKILGPSPRAGGRSGRSSRFLALDWLSSGSWDPLWRKPEDARFFFLYKSASLSDENKYSFFKQDKPILRAFMWIS